MKTILLHGLGQTPSSWDSTIQFLEQQSEIIVPDLFSFIKGNPVKYESLYSAFAEYCIHFHEPLNLCGLSLGGILALRLAIEHPEIVHSLILIGARYNVPKILFKIQNGIFKLMPDQTFKQMGMAKRDFISLSESMTDIDLENGIVHYRHNKNHKSQVTPLCSEMIKILREYLRFRAGKDTDPLFCTEYGLPLTENALRKSIVRYNTRRGVSKTSIHLFRHTFARKYLIDCGGDAFTLQKLLGHSTLQMTKHYCAIFDADIPEWVIRVKP